VVFRETAVPFLKAAVNTPGEAIVTVNVKGATPICADQ
jgi:hypothetical protein